MSAYFLADEAKSDIAEIRRFTLKQWGAEQSTDYMRGLKKTFALLDENQGLGRNRASDFGAEIFSFPHVRHTIYYKKHGDAIAIMAILHQSMVPDKHLYTT